jgi:hypothetical protein
MGVSRFGYGVVPYAGALIRSWIIQLASAVIAARSCSPFRVSDE